MGFLFQQFRLKLPLVAAVPGWLFQLPLVETAEFFFKEALGEQPVSFNIPSKYFNMSNV